MGHTRTRPAGRTPATLKRLAVLSAGLTTFAAAAIASGRAEAQEFSVGAYGSVDYVASRTTQTEGPDLTANQFSIPTLDIFLRGSASKWSFLAEVLFDIDEGNSIGVDLDRMQVSYEVADWLKIAGGRFHTSLGYYNTAYPQGGAVYLVPIDRPAVVDQHDHESIVPTSTVGLNFHGRLPWFDRRVSYDVDLTNGRGMQADDLTNDIDWNNEKMLNLRLRYEINDIIFGANALVDWIPPRTDVTDPALAQPDALREQIFGAHIAYVESPWHMIAEAYFIQHIGPIRTQETFAGILELGYTLGMLTPYARYEFARFPSEKDVFWAATTQQKRGDYDSVSAGVKLVPNETFAFKLELELSHADTDTLYRAAAQVAFGF